MPLLLSHKSALERYRAVPPQLDRSHLVADALPCDDLVPTRSELDAALQGACGTRQEPLHILVSPSAHRQRSSRVIRHYTMAESLPPGSVRSINRDLLVVGPELCLVQMAASISLLGAVVLGYELCGSYAHFAQMASGFYDRPALTSVQRIRKVIGMLHGMRGTERTRQALRWVRDGSASPMETVVASMLSLPCSMGGFGFITPILNYEVPLSASERRIAGKKVVRVDTAYPDTLTGVEFDGKEYHRNAEADRRRREALAHRGWQIYVIDVDKATNYAALADTVGLMDKVPRRRGPEAPDRQKGELLLNRLLRATRFGMGLHGAFFSVEVPKGSVRLHL